VSGGAGKSRKLQTHDESKSQKVQHHGDPGTAIYSGKRLIENVFIKQ